MHDNNHRRPESGATKIAARKISSPATRPKVARESVSRSESARSGGLSPPLDLLQRSDDWEPDTLPNTQPLSGRRPLFRDRLLGGLGTKATLPAHRAGNNIRPRRMRRPVVGVVVARLVPSHRSAGAWPAVAASQRRGVVHEDVKQIPDFCRPFGLRGARLGQRDNVTRESVSRSSSDAERTPALRSYLLSSPLTLTMNKVVISQPNKMRA